MERQLDQRGLSTIVYAIVAGVERGRRRCQANNKSMLVRRPGERELACKLDAQANCLMICLLKDEHHPAMYLAAEDSDGD
jgi:hypothetical protein